MRYRYWIALVALLVPAIVSAQSATCASLSRGSSGPRVTALQEFLHEAYIEFPAATGYFGPVTEAAVKQWQSEHGIVSSGSPATTGWGMVGRRTMAAMGICTAGTVTSSASVSIPASSNNSNPTPSSSSSGSDLVKALNAQVALLLKQITDLKNSGTTPTPTTPTTNTTPVPQTTQQITQPTLPYSISCNWNGTTLMNGALVNAYQSSIVPAGSQCVRETRTCMNGIMSGSYTSPSCIVASATVTASSCTFAGSSISSGNSILAFQNSAVVNSNCVSEWRMCNNGALSGSYPYASCSVTTTSTTNVPPVSGGMSCTFNGTPIMDGDSVPAYPSASVPFGSNCIGEMRTCDNGVLSGSNQYAMCNVGSAASCAFNGSTVSSGASVTAYQSSSVAYGSSCVSESRGCTNGTLSGSYQNASCTVGTGVSCVFNGQTIVSGGSVAAFQNTTSNSSCVSQTRTCTNGTLSGSSAYAYDHCSVQSQNASLPNTFVPVTYNGKNVQLHGWFATPGGAGPYPAVIIAHGCSGINPDNSGSDWTQENNWAQTLRGWGYATLILDSFTARGMPGGVCGNSDIVSPQDRSQDMYSAATVLAKMSSVNPQKIGLFGSSHGANAVSWPIRNNQSATQAAQSALTAAGGKISASVGLYPTCDTALSGPSYYAPYFVAIGSNDSESNPATCKSLTNYPSVSNTPVDINNMGALIRIIVYANAGHRFDVQNSGAYSASITADVQNKIKTFFDTYVK